MFYIRCQEHMLSCDSVALTSEFRTVMLTLPIIGN